MSEPVLKIENLAFGYSEKESIFEELNLSLDSDEKAGLVGANGSGKTTLFQLLMGFRKPQAGSIRWFGKQTETEHQFATVRQKAGLLFQNPDDQLFCATVGEDVAFGPFNLGLSRKDVSLVVEETLSSLGLQGYENRITYHLSEGEKRLVSLACVLAMKPSVLLLDEPTNGLDEKARDLILQELQALPQAMLIASHDRTFLDTVTSRTVLL